MLIEQLMNGDFKSLARAISLVENEIPGYEEILKNLKHLPKIPVVGITGPPGAGKSSLVNALVTLWAKQGLKVGIIAVDPASPFNFGALLGDRLRMSALYTIPGIFIRSISTRGSLGGLSACIVEVTELFRNAGFDRIIIETVGVGQSEVEIAGVADTTVVVTVPESGDEVQTLKSGVMEIANIYVVNKCDRPGSELFSKYLNDLVHSKPASEWDSPVILTNALNNTGIDSLSEAIASHHAVGLISPKRFVLLAEKLARLVMRKRMSDFDISDVARKLQQEANNPDFNLYLFSQQFTQ